MIILIEAIITGLIVGLLGYILIEKFLRNKIIHWTPGKQLLAIVLLGFLLQITSLYTVFNYLIDFAQVPPTWIWLFLLAGIFSIPTFGIIVIVLYKISIGGISEFINYTYEIMGTIIAAVIGFVFGFFYVDQSSQLNYVDRELFTLFNIFQGVFAGSIAAFFSFITRKLLSRVI
jgi:hypothetical protein